MHVGAQERHPDHRCRRHLLGQTSKVGFLPVGHQGEVGQVAVQATEVCSCQGFSAGPERLGQGCGEVRVHPVDHQGGHRDIGLGQFLGKESGLGHRVAVGRCHQHEGSRWARQQVQDQLGALLETLFHAVEGLEESNGVVEHFAAHHL